MGLCGGQISIADFLGLHLIHLKSILAELSNGALSLRDIVLGRLTW
jgi:hypothetical protein